MARLVLATAGAVVGGMIGGPTGAQAGWVIGSMVGATFEPNKKTEGPRLGDLTVSSSSYGATIPWVAGTPRVAGQIIWASAKREIATTTSQGKGGGGGQESTSYTYEVDLLFLVSANQIAGISRIWSNGKLVFNGMGSIETLMASGGTDKWARVTSYSGAPGQLPDPTYEAAVGSANASAYRGRGTVFIQSLQLGSSGAIPNLTFEIANSQTGTVACLQHFEEDGTTKSNASAFGYYQWWITDVPAAIGPKWNFELYGVSDTGDLRNVESGIKPGLYGESCFRNAQILNIISGGTKTTKQYANAYVNLDSSFDVAVGQDYSIEFVHDPIEGNDIYPANIYNSATSAALLYFGSAADGGWFIQNIFNGSARAYNFVSYPSGGGINGAAIIPNGPVRVCVTKTGNDLRIYYNGVLSATALGVASASYWKGLGQLVVGAQSIGAGTAGQTTGGEGRFDEILLIKGVSIASGATYTPATAQYADSSSITVASRTPPTLQSVVNSLCAQAGLSAGQYDTSALAAITAPVRALAISQVSSARAVLEILARSYNFEATISDKIYFRVRGAAPVAAIPYDDLGCDGSEPFILRTQNDLEIPSQIALSYANLDNDHQSGTEYSDRLLTGQTNTLTTQVPLAFLASEAKAIADTLLTDKVVSARSASLSLPIKYAALEPVDVITVQDQDGTSWRLRVVKRTDANGQIQLDTVADDASVFTQSGTTSAGTQSQSIVAAPSVCTLSLLDIPLLQDADNSPGHYFAIKGASVGWANGSLYHSMSDGNYQLSQTVTDQAVFGTTQTILNTYSGPLVWDDASTVQVNVGIGQLSSATKSDILANKSLNSALVGSELLQFANATLVSTGIYTLSGFLRGLRGTEGYMTGHAVGEKFVLLTSGTGLGFQPLSSADLGKVGYYRAVGLGQRVSSATTRTLTATSVNLKPFAPTDLRVNRVSADTAFTWKRRTRLATRFTGTLGINVPLGESAETYDVEFYSDATFTTLKRTYAGLSAPAATYTSAHQVTDFGSTQSDFYIKVFQNSTVVGRGFPLTVNATKPLEADTTWLVGSGGTISNGGRNWSGGGSQWAWSAFCKPTGKRYFEFQISGTLSTIGLGNASANPGVGNTSAWGGVFCTWRGGTVYINGVAQTSASGIVANDYVGIAVDIDAGKLWLMRNGAAVGAGGSPSAGTGGYTITATQALRAIAYNGDGGSMAANLFATAPGNVKYPIAGFTSWIS
jgi:Putative phage tail protein